MLRRKIAIADIHGCSRTFKRMLFECLHVARQAMLWDRYQHSDRIKQQGKVLVVGHTVTNEEDIRRSLKSRFIRLDNGCYMGGRIAGLGCLAALELQTGQLHLEGNCEGIY